MLAQQSITETFTDTYTFEDSGISVGPNGSYEFDKAGLFTKILEVPKYLGTLESYEVTINYTISRQIQVSTSLGDSGSVFNATLQLRAETSKGYGSIDAEETLSWPWNCPCDPVESESGTLAAGSFSVSGPASKSGGAIPVKASVDLNTGQGSVDSLSWKIVLSATVKYTYVPMNTTDIIGNLLNDIDGTNRLPRDVADECVDDAQRLREFGAATSATNLEARCAEYFCRGLSGGYQGIFGSVTPGNIINDLGNRLPFSLSIYNSLKEFKESLGLNLAGDDELPNSPPGGEECFAAGHKFAEQHPTIDQVIDNVGPDTTAPPVPCVEGNNCEPTQPDLSFIINDDDLNTDTSVFLLAGAKSNTAYLFDPPMTNAYGYATPHNRMTRLTIPNELADILSNIVVVVAGQSYPIAVGETLDLTEIQPQGVPSFTILTDVAEGSEDLHMLVVLEFLHDGESILMTFSSEAPQEQAINSSYNDAWYNADTDGQGFLIIVFEDIKSVFLSWFTFDTVASNDQATLGGSGQRWVTAFGSYEGDTAVLDIISTSQGQFDTGTEVQRDVIGTLTLSFDDCQAGTVEYDIPGLDLQGEIDIQRVVTDLVAQCQQKTGSSVTKSDLSSARADSPQEPLDHGGFHINWGLNDAWYNPATDGQGFFIISWPDIKYMFLAWFTYETEIPASNSALLGDSGQRWLTAQGPYDQDTATLDITVTTKGRFNSGEPISNASGGTATVVFEDCENGSVSYDMGAIGKQGSVPIQRIVLDNVTTCEELVDISK
ncbi:hypothetical protein ACFL07_04990 [Pseudomonadota bacterium]